MPFYDDVKKGDPFKPNAMFFNDLSHFLNERNGFSAGKWQIAFSNPVCINCYNTEEATLKAQSAVALHPDKEMLEDLVPVRAYMEDDTKYGILLDTVEPGKTGRLLVCGPAKVKVSGRGDYAEPDDRNPGIFKLGESGVPVLFQWDDIAVILMGSPVRDDINTAFKVSFDDEGKLFVSGGQINRNGTIITAGIKGGIEPKAGTLCVKSKIETDPNGRNGESKWSEPDYLFTSPAPDAWPIADIEEVTDGEGRKSYVIHQRITNIAVLLVSKQCPLTRKGSM